MGPQARHQKTTGDLLHVTKRMIEVVCLLGGGTIMRRNGGAGADNAVAIPLYSGGLARRTGRYMIAEISFGFPVSAVKGVYLVERRPRSRQSWSTGNAAPGVAKETDSWD